MRLAAAVEPELVVVADGVDDERVAFPSSDGVSPPRRDQIVEMLPPIHIDDAMRTRIASFVQDVDVRQTLRRVGHRELPRIRIHARHAHWKTRGVRFVLLLALVPKL